jgi:hypothetical protein
MIVAAGATIVAVINAATLKATARIRGEQGNRMHIGRIGGRSRNKHVPPSLTRLSPAGDRRQAEIHQSLPELRIRIGFVG